MFEAHRNDRAPLPAEMLCKDPAFNVSDLYPLPSSQTRGPGREVCYFPYFSGGETEASKVM